MNSQTELTLSEATKIGKAGTQKEVIFLMRQLKSDAPIATCKIIDHALSLINTVGGRDKIRDYLFHGTSIQRSYAVLYFKRAKDYKVLRQAVKMEVIDEEFAFCR